MTILEWVGITAIIGTCIFFIALGLDGIVSSITYQAAYSKGRRDAIKQMVQAEQEVKNE